MTYWVDVTLQKIVCRDPESLTTGDRFTLAGAIFTDRGAKSFVTPIRILRTNESFTYNESIFSGFAEAPAVGIAFTAWDKDLNTAWVRNEQEIREKEAEIDRAIKDANILGAAAYSVLEFGARFVVGAIDVLVNHDLDDQLVDYKAWIQLEDVAPPTKRVHVHEVKFHRRDPAGLSDWDYSLFFLVSHYQLFTAPFPSMPDPTWMEFHELTRPSRVSDWLGSWRSSLIEANPRVRVDITAGATPELMNVRIIEQVSVGEFTLQREGVPISRVFLDYGHRDLVTVGSVFPTDQSVGGIPMVGGVFEPVTEVNLVSIVGDDFISRTPINPVAFPINVIARQQIGTDIIWLGDVVIEAYRLSFQPGANEGVALRYMRPVNNVLYRDNGAEVVLPLEAAAEF